MWVRGEYLLWWVKDSPFPHPVSTTGPFDANAFVASTLAGTRPPTPGGLATPGTRNLFGGTGMGFGTFSGVRLTLGSTFDDEGVWGCESSGFLLERRSASANIATDPAGNPLLARPFVNSETNRPNTLIIGAQSDTAGLLGGQTGSVSDVLTTRLWGRDANLSFVFVDTNTFRATALVGFRYLDLHEKLVMNSVSSPTGLALPLALGPLTAEVGDSLFVRDTFGTRNQFYGGQIGGRFEYLTDLLSVGLTTKVAVGSTREKLYIDGLSGLNGKLVGQQTLPGGLYAQGSNSGVFTNRDIAVVPEVGLDLGINLASWARLNVGYSFLYWSRVVRPGNQVNPLLDTRQIPTLPNYTPALATSNPPVGLNRTDFWAHGLNFGLTLSF